jgi:hypothetical protein
MPVSKKRKKAGKPVQRSAPVVAPEGEGHEGGEAKPSTHPQQRMGKPSNPFVGQHQMPKSSQRGR